MSITVEYLRDRLDYDPLTGDFTWKAREIKSIQHVRWNSRWIGSKAGSISRQGYREIRIDDKTYPASHLAWMYVYGYLPTIIDHIDHNKSNNAITNLREASFAENIRNQRVKKHSSTQLKGVHEKTEGIFHASITLDGQRKHLGVYDTANAAAIAYDNAARELHGEFACLNFPNISNASVVRYKAPTKYLRGVSYRPDRGKYKVRFMAEGVNIYVGLFDTEEEAGRAYDNAAREILGDRAKLNFP